MTMQKYKHLFLFFGLATLIPWAFWFAAAYLSHLTPGRELYVVTGGILGVIGLAAPAVTAFIIMFSNSDLRKDVMRRVFNLRTVKPFYLFATCFLMLGSILLAQGISLAFGGSPNQFRLAGKFSFSGGLFPAWFLLFLAPLLEELAWHTYGTDSLRTRMNLLTASILFAVFWALWHFPLSFIKDYYHSNLVETGWLYTLNFTVSIIPFVILMNWLYYRTGRNILVAVVFHITAGYFNEIFMTEPNSKVIQTGLLILLSIVLVVKERSFFFDRDFSSLEA
jgi:uncharacterized protein